MEEHVRNGFEPYSTLRSPTPLLQQGKPTPARHLQAEISKAALAADSEGVEDEGQPAIDMIDFDLQGFETSSIEKEAGAVEALTDHVGFIHFVTHGTEVEATLLRILQPKGWCVVPHEGTPEGPSM